MSLPVDFWEHSNEPWGSIKPEGACHCKTFLHLVTKGS